MAGFDLDDLALFLLQTLPVLHRAAAFQCPPGDTRLPPLERTTDQPQQSHYTPLHTKYFFRSPAKSTLYPEYVEFYFDSGQSLYDNISLVSLSA